MKQLWDSIRSHLNERLESPVIASFIVAWLCWNHQYLVILFSNVPLEYRFTLANNLLYSDGWYVRGFLWPLATSAVFILVYPYLTRWVMSYWLRQNQITKAARDEIEKSTLLTVEESRKIILDATQARGDYLAAIQSQSREIDALKNAQKVDAPAQQTIEEQRQRIVVLESEVNRLRNQLEPQDPLARYSENVKAGLRNLLVLIASAPQGAINELSVGPGLKVAPVMATHLIDRALESSLIERSGQADRVLLRLSVQGRAYLVKEKLVSLTTQ